ncbi:MAG: hypothetical protein CFE46_17955 [Burkholderiales bacterium PBB6]|nr:MAG: hypothetical protein CFE46_17955 [Burkholderiales bacterium PBB6]
MSAHRLTRAGAWSLLVGAGLISAAVAAPPVAPARIDLLSSAYTSQMLTESVYTGFNPKASPTFFQPGVKLAFYGQSRGCPSSATMATSAGAVLSSREAEVGKGQPLAALTGLPAGEEARRRVWMPSPRSEGCAGLSADEAGATPLLQVNATPGQTGLGLYTPSGPDARGRAPQFGPFDAAGQNGHGANAYIAGAFAIWRQPASGPAVQPLWQGVDDEWVIRSSQSVQQLSVDPTSTEDSLAQVKQQIVAVVLNPSCQAERHERPRACQLQYLFHTAIARSAVSDWAKVAWFQRGMVFFDPAQGGMPVVQGPIPPKGQGVNEAASGLALYRSEGGATGHAPFDARAFEVRVPFKAFLLAQRAAVARQLKKAAANVRDDELVEVFGSQWNQPQAWVLLSTSVAQETYNRDPARAAVIGGAVRSLVLSVEPP